MNPSTQPLPTNRSASFLVSPMRSILTCAVLLGTAALATADVKLKGDTELE